MSNEAKAGTDIPLSPKPSSLEDALAKSKPIIVGGKPLDTVTVFCSSGKVPKTKTVRSGGKEITVVVCE